MKARLRLVAGVLLATIAVMVSGCGMFPGTSGPAKPSASTPANATTATPAATATTPVAATTAFAPAPKPPSADPVLTSGNWGYHATVDYDDYGGGHQIHTTAEQRERYQLIKEQYYDLLAALKDSSGVEELVEKAGGDVSDIKYSVVDIDALDTVGESTPWVTATLRASFPTEDGLKAVDVFVYRLKTSKGLNNTPYVSGTSVGYVDTDGSIDNPSHPNFPR